MKKWMLFILSTFVFKQFAMAPVELPLERRQNLVARLSELPDELKRVIAVKSGYLGSLNYSRKIPVYESNQEILDGCTAYVQSDRYLYIAFNSGAICKYDFEQDEFIKLVDSDYKDINKLFVVGSNLIVVFNSGIRCLNLENNQWHANTYQVNIKRVELVLGNQRLLVYTSEGKLDLLGLDLVVLKPDIIPRGQIRDFIYLGEGSVALLVRASIVFFKLNDADFAPKLLSVGDVTSMHRVGNTLVVTLADNSIKVISNDGRLLKHYQQTRLKRATALSRYFSNRFLTGSTDKKIRYWDPSLLIAGVYKNAHADKVVDILPLSDINYFASVGCDNYLMLWHRCFKQYPKFSIKLSTHLQPKKLFEHRSKLYVLMGNQYRTMVVKVGFADKKDAPYKKVVRKGVTVDKFFRNTLLPEVE